MSTPKPAVPAVKYRRIILKLSGEVLRGGKSGDPIDAATLEKTCAQVKEIHDLGVQVCVVIGGGNIFRGLNGAKRGVDRTTGDYMGMLATDINGLAIMDCLEKMGVSTRVQSAIPQLPKAVQNLGITINKQSTNLTVVVSLLSPDGTYDSTFLSNYANAIVQPVLSRVDGVGSITIFGLLQYSMRVWLDPERLTAMNLSAQDVASAVYDQNQQAAIGSVGATPTVGSPSFNLTLTTKGR
ncbi:MAG: efflux RND transporter permease subunit, partial [Cephaloticoccus sp.]